VAVFQNEHPATDRGTHWQGGPDLAIEIVSPGDRSRDKLEFYASINTRELLIIDREPWTLELHRLSGEALVESKTLDLVTLPLSWELATRDGVTVLVIRRRDDGREWLIAT
jgi:Uma2 family endonuclease